MAVPKKKTSVSRQGNRRSHDALKTIVVSECPNCGEMKRSHHICPSCGYYDSKEVLATSSESESV
jgi:large subunit ribosomal protein L32